MMRMGMVMRMMEELRCEMMAAAKKGQRWIVQRAEVHALRCLAGTSCVPLNQRMDVD